MIHNGPPKSHAVVLDSDAVDTGSLAFAVFMPMDKLELKTTDDGNIPLALTLVTGVINIGRLGKRTQDYPLRTVGIEQVYIKVAMSDGYPCTVTYGERIARYRP
ncbi:Os04g0310450 [Oryza sativa Japonica Group]|uniref:Os04g0310450 protein n=1 Tax=Oryza sativa subsp. japonica TaxID=39947 RepID=A0A0P0W923_ORYSJ|nr:Os04g0310450 [Oryza sativa Japonica Group]